MMDTDMWASQLDGRLIQQHISLIEPELQARHLERLARLTRGTLVSHDLVKELAVSRPVARASAFLLEYFLSGGAWRSAELLSSHILGGLPENRIVRVDGQFDDPGIAIVPLQLSDQHGLDFIPRLAIGAVVAARVFDRLLEGVSSSTLAEATCAGVVATEEIIANDEKVLFVSSSALYSQWANVEEGVLIEAGKAIEPSQQRHQQAFAANVRLEFLRRQRGQQSAIADPTIPPTTPACRDLFLAWTPSPNRASNTIGSPINHCVSIADVVKLYDNLI